MSVNTEPALFTKLGFDPAYQSTFEDKTFIEGPQTARRLVTFFTLLLLATVIANYGVLSNSDPTVIGAMIVAPLMGPIIATTSAVVLGSLPRALRALALTVAGIIAVILFSFLLSWIVPSFAISFTNNGEITSRINPGLLALLTALGAGAAGAFIVSRAEIADALGGVAIAISLVPPLCVVGISLRCGQMSAALGSFPPLYDQLSRHSVRGRRGPDNCRRRKVGCLDRAKTFAPSGHHYFRSMPCAHSHSPFADSISKHHWYRG